jgi:hypothetical protein
MYGTRSAWLLTSVLPARGFHGESGMQWGSTARAFDQAIRRPDTTPM